MHLRLRSNFQLSVRYVCKIQLYVSNVQAPCHRHSRGDGVLIFHRQRPQVEASDIIADFTSQRRQNFGTCGEMSEA